MKSLFVGIALLCSGVSYADTFVNQAELGRPQSILSAGFRTFSIDPRESFAGANSGRVTVDTLSRQVSVFFERRPVCAPGTLCPQFIENLGSMTLPLVSVQTNACGVVTYTATRNLLPVDGDSKTIVVSNNMSNHCPTLIRLIPTEVTVREIPARASFNEERVSEFEADVLQNVASPTLFAQ